MTEKSKLFLREKSYRTMWWNQVGWGQQQDFLKIAIKMILKKLMLQEYEQHIVHPTDSKMEEFYKTLPIPWIAQVRGANAQTKYRLTTEIRKD